MRCKAGDLAFIKKALRTSNIGLIVTCKELLGYMFKDEEFEWNGEKWHAQDTDYIWVIESPSSSLDTLFGKSRLAYLPDSWLTPIKADGLDTDESTEETLEDNLETS